MKFTWQILAQAWTADLIRIIASRLKLHPDTVGAWKRPPESDEFPSGTGKANIIDHIKFVICQIHKSFPGVAREIAEHISAYVDYLDRAEGVSLAETHSTPCIALAETVKESADVIITLAGKPNDPQAWKQGRKEIRESVSSLMKLDGCLETLIEREAGKRNAFIREEEGIPA